MDCFLVLLVSACTLPWPLSLIELICFLALVGDDFASIGNLVDTAARKEENRLQLAKEDLRWPRGLR